MHSPERLWIKLIKYKYYKIIMSKGINTLREKGKNTKKKGDTQMTIPGVFGYWIGLLAIIFIILALWGIMLG